MSCSVAATMEELANAGPSAPVDAAVHPIAREALTRVTGHWPQLAAA